MNVSDNSNLEKEISEPVKNGKRKEVKHDKLIKKTENPSEVKEKTTTGLNSTSKTEVLTEKLVKPEKCIVLNGNCDGLTASVSIKDNDCEPVKESLNVPPKKKRKISASHTKLSEVQDEPSVSESEKSSTTPDKVKGKELNTDNNDWSPGDLVWAHMTGYPWWPGLIENDPIQKICTRIQGKGRWFHVQFFGVDVVRGWVKSIMKYEGESHFKDMKDNLAQITRKSDPRVKRLSWFEVKPSRHSVWQAAVDEAEEALLCEKEERRIRFGVEYFDVPVKEQQESLSPEKRKNARRKVSKIEDVMPKSDNKFDSNSLSIPSSTTVNGTSNTDHSSEDIFAKDDSSDHKASPQRNKKPVTVCRTEGNFKLFLEKHADKVKEEHPNFDDTALETFLEEQWEQMTIQQKSRYISRFDNIEKTPVVESKAVDPPLSPESIFRKRAHKPSQRFLEAAGTNLYPSPRSSKKSPKTSPISERKSKTENIFEKMEKISSENSLKSQKAIEKPTLKLELGTNEEIRNIVNMNEDSPAEIEATESCASVSSHCSNTSNRSVAETRLDKICQVCFNPVVSGSKNYVKCEGACNLSFHKACLNLTIQESSFKCNECTEGVHTCFACKEKSETTRKCILSYCGRFYHESCLKKYPAAKMESKGFTCPLHVCVSCIPDSLCEEHIVHRGRMVRCIRCPTAYHVRDSCLAAGTEVLTSNTMVCPSHYDKTQRQRSKQINVNWCFICSSGGSLICCESCPAAFHAECLHIEPPEGNYYCRDCALGRHPKFGNIVWVKLGCYRWWPARILHPKSVPENIQELKHQIGEFPVEFFGSHDYYWTNRSRVFLYQEGDKGNENASNRALAKSYDKALREANEAFLQWKALKETRDDKSRVRQKPPPFKTIKSNKPVGKVQALPSCPLEGTPCECNPAADAPCGSDSDCLNRMVMFECNAAVCPAGLNCCNQRFQKRQYAETKPFKTTNRGWGLKALTDISTGQFVIEYVGELVDEDECKERMKKMHEMDKTDYYFLTLDKDRIIDAGEKGNLARFMNHSCQPNCETQKWTVNGDTRVGLFATCNIPAGTELTFNYYLDCLGNEKRPCNCHAPLCSGFIGIRPKISTNGTVSGEVKKPSEIKKKKRQKNTNDKKESADEKSENGVDNKDTGEDECFYCKDGGELILCDRQNCPKAYHLRCVKISGVPDGVWECPWHNCDVCSEPSMLLCADCPSSFCPSHHAHSIAVLPGGRVVCRKHVSRKRKTESDSEVESKVDELEAPPTTTKRKVGRPRKSVDPGNDIVEEKMNGNSSEKETIPKRGRGRPRKEVQVETSSTEGDDEKEQNDVKDNKINEGLRNIFETFSTVPPSAEKNLVESVSVIKEIEIAEEQEQTVKKENNESVRKKIEKRKLRSAGLSLRPQRMHRRTRVRRSRNGSHIATINGSKRKAGRPRKKIVPVVEKVTSGSQNGESSSSKDDDETTAIITVETDGMADIGLKPFVQKYKLENGEFSLEEYTENEEGTVTAE